MSLVDTQQPVDYSGQASQIPTVTSHSAWIDALFTLGFVGLTVTTVIYLRPGRYPQALRNFVTRIYRPRSYKDSANHGGLSNCSSRSEKDGLVETEMAEEMAWLSDLPYHPSIHVNRLSTQQRSRRVLAGVLLPLITLVMIVFTIRAQFVLPQYQSSPEVTPAVQLPVEADTPSIPRILIFQHTLPSLTYQDLISASINGHVRYAEAHGHRHIVDDQQYIVDSSKQGSHFLNKLYALKELVQTELEKGEDACEWIWMTDIDTLIVNPTIPIHHLLPPSTLNPTPLMLGNEDKAGFNAGSVLYHLEPALLDLIQYSFDVVNEHLQYNSHPSDQYAIHRALLDHPELGERFYEIPQFWTNPYENYKDFNVLQYHLGCGLKFTEDWGVVVKEADAIWEQARLVGDGDEALGVGRMGWSGEDAKMGVAWWSREELRNGIEGMGFSGI